MLQVILHRVAKAHEKRYEKAADEGRNIAEFEDPLGIRDSLKITADELDSLTDSTDELRRILESNTNNTSPKGTPITNAWCDVSGKVLVAPPDHIPNLEPS